jgi:energy-coupling factor transporter ATP-binding protein EcfA2
MHSLKWLWTHTQYQAWSASNVSRLLYVQGKPGSGKSTLAKYFRDNIQLDSSPAIIADFFYSDREGELQRSHYSMLQSILYNILKQGEQFFFFFQSEYRKCSFVNSKRAWPYESLLKVLLSFGDHAIPGRLYLIIDAMDESNDNSKDRRNILQVLFDLCSKKNGCIVKVFITSRPIGVLEHRIEQFHNFIRLQDETRDDIISFANSFLGPDLKLTGDLLQRATDYIVEHAQGVFVWLNLVKEELQSYAETGYSERDIFDVLKSLPTELEDFYTRILRRLSLDSQRNIRDAMRMFQFVLYSCRPLTVIELQHALAIQNGYVAEFPSDESFKENIFEEIEKRIIHCGGNLLEIKDSHGIFYYLLKALSETLRLIHL